MKSLLRSPWLVAFVLALILLIGWDVTRRFSLDASMEHFLPGQGERALYRVSRKIVDSTLTGRMVVTVGLTSEALSAPERRQELAKLILEAEPALKDIVGIKGVTRGPAEGIEEDFYRLYFPRRFSFLSLDPKADSERLFSDRGLALGAIRLQEKLNSVESPLVRQTAPKDPWLLFPEVIERLSASNLSLEVEQGQFFARPKHTNASSEDWAVVFLELSDSALNADAQIPVLSGLEKVFQGLTAPPSAELKVEMSGANRFAVDTQTRMKTDIQRIYGLSTLGMILLFLGLFRSARRILYLVLPIASGLVIASWVSLLLYGRIHALTLGFGGSLIGVAIDYPVHVLSHHDLDAPGRSGPETIKRLLPTLTVAAGTTVLGLLGLGWTAFPGIREIAVFTGVGVTSALVITLLLGSLLPPSGGASSFAKKVSSALEMLLRQVRKSPRVSVAVLVGAGVLALFGVARVRFAPGLDSLAPLSPTLLAEDTRVQARIGEADAGRLVIVTAARLEDALRVNEKVALVLQDLKENKKVDGFTSATLLLRSEEFQRKADRQLRQTPNLARRTRDALEQAGFVPEAFPALEAELKDAPAPLTLGDLEDSKLGGLISPFVLKLEKEWAVITPLKGKIDEIAVTNELKNVAGAEYFSQRRLLNEAYSDLRTRTTELLLFGLLLIFGAALLRYRNFRRAGAAILPSVLASGATVGILSLAGQELNLLHLLGLLLVCSMGVDYGVFLVDSKPNEERSSLFSITLGCTSTMLSFGVLAFSSAPALSALGGSVALGICLSLLLAPISLLLISPRPSASLGN